MMTAGSSETILGERLARLTGDDPSCCVPGYEADAKKVIRSRPFSEALSRIKALADERRLLSVALLKRKGELCACEVQAATGLSHATVSHHMAILVEAGLVKERRQGKWMYYRLGGTIEVNIP